MCNITKFHILLSAMKTYFISIILFVFLASACEKEKAPEQQSGFGDCGTVFINSNSYLGLKI